MMTEFLISGPGALPVAAVYDRRLEFGQFLSMTLIRHLSGKSRAKCARCRNPKSEVRNPKQVKNTNAEIFKRSEGLFSFSAVLIFHQLFRISGFEIRISRRSSWFRLRRVRCHARTAVIDRRYRCGGRTIEIRWPMGARQLGRLLPAIFLSC